MGSGPGSRAGEFIEGLTIKEQTQSVKDDVPRSIPIHGYLYDVATGLLHEVVSA